MTGALDSGLQLFRKGMEVTVLFPEAGFHFSADLSGVLVLDTESRNVCPDEAAAKVEQAVALLTARGIPVIYKKVDSTLRGNPGAEIGVILESCGFDAALLTPALPDTGRTVRNGTLFVNGIPVSDTGFSADPHSPVRSSIIAEIIGPATSIPCEGIGGSEIADAVRNPSGFLESRLSQHRPCILIADAENDDDIRKLSVFVAGCGGRVLPCGSAGLLRHLAEFMTAHNTPRAGGPDTTKVGPVLVVSSSMTTETRRQIDHAEDCGAAIRIKPVEKSLFSGSYTATECGRQAMDLLAEGKNVIVDAGGKREELPGDRAQAAERSSKLQAFLSELAIEIFESRAAETLGGLVVTGGETAITVSNALGAYGIRICGEVEPVVPAGVMLGGIAHGLPVVTKAGGFGSDAVLSKAIRYLSPAGRTVFL